MNSGNIQSALFAAMNLSNSSDSDDSVFDDTLLREDDLSDLYEEGIEEKKSIPAILWITSRIVYAKPNCL